MGYPVFRTPQTKFLTTPPVALGMERPHPLANANLRQGIFKDKVTSGDIRLKGHGRGVTRGTPGSGVEISPSNLYV